MAAALAVTALGAGCAGAPQVAPPDITPELLLRAEPLTGAVDPPPLPDVPVLGLDEPMRAFLDRYVQKDGAAHLRLHQLLDAIIDDDVFKIEYDQVTRTAAETFSERRGNCLSFTNMFVAMAREVGLKATYQEVDIPPDWTLDGDSLLLSRHVNVHVELGAARDRIVDFNIEDFHSHYDQWRVTDARAFSHFYNNVGVRRMQDGEPVEALRYFRKALEQDGRFAPAWSNLGTLYLRNGHAAAAEAAWRQALASNPRELVAMSNMTRLLRQQGRTGEAAHYQGLIARHRMQNPYYRYHLARQAFLASDYDAAIGHLKFAVRKKPAEDTFYLLLGLSYLQQHDAQAARRWLERAEAVATDEALKRNYRSKLELLLGKSADGSGDLQPAPAR
jgi:Flp pilus assembly protein TadD